MSDPEVPQLIVEAYGVVTPPPEPEDKDDS
jgi:hypothetical protein